MNTDSHLPGSANPSTGDALTRRTFIKRTAGTVLVFGIGLQMAAYAQNVTADKPYKCGGYTCQTNSVTNIGTGPDTSGCATAQRKEGFALHNCTLIHGVPDGGERACKKKLVDGKKKLFGIPPNNSVCVW